MRKSRSYTLAAALGIASVIAAVSCTLNTEGGLADVPTPTPDSSLGGSGGSFPDVVQEKDTSVEGDTGKPDVKPDVHEAGDVVTEQQECFPGMKVCNGECVDNDLAIWGCDMNVCTPCDLPNAVESCSAGHCAVQDCELINPADDSDANPKAPRWGDCNAPKWDDGCETRLDTPQNCGACGVTCSPKEAVPTCTTGTCAIGSCNDGYADCDGKVESGCEVNIHNDPTNCGQCGNVCKLTPGATKMTCLNGECVPDDCETGKKDCDNDASNGCETDITQVANCNGCGINCSDDFINGIAECKPVGFGWACALKQCVPPFENCNGNTDDGCEVNTQTNPAHCGGCNAACSTTNGSNPQCASGQCVLTCNPDFTNCEDPAQPAYDTARNGCETNIKGAPGDPLNCGGCGWTCEKTNASNATCADGLCSYVCNVNFDNCNGKLPGNVDDGCEVDKRIDPANCGACGTKCSSNGGTAVCNVGACNTTCDSAHRNCNGSVTDGCEVDITSDEAHCGACGTKCEGGNATWECSNGACNVLGCSSSAWGDCDGLDNTGCEASLSTLANCGGCGTVCGQQNATATCTSGTCNILCQDSWGNCDNNAANGCETSVNADPAHCGPSCTSCPQPPNSTRKCSAGVCSFDCSAGFGNCDTNATNGCEVNLGTSTLNCGTCGKQCTAANATPSCVSGTCGIQSCNAGWGNCDANLGNGCETQVSSNPDKCGAACLVCPTVAHSTRTCVTGSCSFTCDTGWGNCDNTPGNGCETDTNSDENNCGQCAKVCTGPNELSWTCSSGMCLSPVCKTNWGNCDLNDLNGCESNLLTASQNCGACGNDCTKNNKTCDNGSCK